MNDTSLRDALLAAEAPSTELESRYHEKLRSITERRITTRERVGMGIGLAGCVAFGALLVRWMIAYPAHFNPNARPLLWVWLGLLVMLVHYSVAEWRRGVVRRDGALPAQVVGVCAVVGVALLYWTAVHTPDAARGNHKLLVGVLVWTMAALPYLIVHFVRESEQRVRTDLLRLELAIVELREQRTASTGE
jgi:hypothetical protein